MGMDGRLGTSVRTMALLCFAFLVLGLRLSPM